MMRFATIDWIVVASCLAFLVILGVSLVRRGEGFTEFFLAGRSLTTPLLTATPVSSCYGIDVVLGSSQLAFTDGVVT